MKKGKVHFALQSIQGTWLGIACNSLRSDHSSDPERVTCLTCRKSRAWKEAMKR